MKSLLSCKNLLHSWKFSPSCWRFGSLRRWPCGKDKNVLNAQIFGTHFALVLVVVLFFYIDHKHLILMKHNIEIV